MYEVDGKKYHMFTLQGLHRAVDILADPYTGELFFYDTGIKPQSLDKWYVEYRVSHKAEFGKRINEKFEWIEKPSMQNGAIVGKVKNISNKTFSATKINFTLYDSSGSQLGNAFDIITNFKAVNTWSFKVDVYKQNVASYEFEDVDYKN